MAIKIFTRSQTPDDDYLEGGPLYGYNPDAVTIDCYEDRAEALYCALGVARDDADYSIGVLADGRWALVGLDVAGHQCAAELAPSELKTLLSEWFGDGSDALIGEITDAAYCCPFRGSGDTGRPE